VAFAKVPPVLVASQTLEASVKIAVIIHYDATCASSGGQLGAARVDGWKVIYDV
jgi:hypothetical protein